MTLLASFSISNSGLQAQSTALSGTSNNLSNASTTGYKGTSTNFQALVSDYSTAGSNGLGVSASTRYNNGDQGTIAASNSDTHLALDGSGYFVVKSGTTNADGTVTFNDEEYYTRAGDFSVDKNGYLVNSEGYYLCGWSVDPATGDVDKTTIAPIQVSSDSTNAAIASTKISYVANLPTNLDVGTTSVAKTTPVYDSLGDTHDVSYTWEKTGASQWTLNIGAAGGDSGSDYASQVVVNFGTDGSVESVDPGDFYSVSGTTISYNLTYSGAATQTITCDLSKLTQFAGTSVSPSTFTADGVASGSYKGVSISDGGNVSIVYTNSQISTIYEIPVATFQAENKLETVTGTAYRATAASGTATYNEAGSGGAGNLKTSSLESSTVDLASEFTNLISEQQIYSANAKALTTANSMMETLIQLQS